MALPIYLNAVGLDTLKDGIALIGVGGKGNLAKWWRLYTAYKIPTFICFDNDTGDDGSGVKRKDALKAIGIAEEFLEDLLITEDWNMNSGYCVFGKDFEKTMRNSFPKYNEIEETERQRLGDSKPVVAKGVASILQSTVNNQEIGWQQFELLKQKILALK